MISKLRSALALTPKHSDSSVKIHLRAMDVLPFVRAVRHNADLERDALGFLPEQAYEAAAQSGHLFVASRQECGSPICVGHLFFGGAFPHARVYQLHVTANARKRGVARGLVDALVVFAEQHGYMDITARVAADLAANAVWEKMGFATVRTQPGGSVRNRTINVRMKLCVARIPSGHKTRVRFCNLGSVAAV